MQNWTRASLATGLSRSIPVALLHWFDISIPSDPLNFLGSDKALIATRRRGALGCALFFQSGSRDKPLPLKPLSIGLTSSGIFRVRIERMSIILDLIAIGIGHNTQRPREGG
jgi:hypothetical protein